MFGPTARQYAAALASTFSVSVTGICFAWLAPLMSMLVGPESEIPGLTTDDTSWLVSVVEIGEVISTLPGGLLADRRPIVMKLGMEVICYMARIKIYQGPLTHQRSLISGMNSKAIVSPIRRRKQKFEREAEGRMLKMTERYGRKPLLLSVGPMCLVGWILVLTTRSLAVLYVVRLIHGVALGFVYAIVPMYIAEIAEPRIRGELSGHFMTMWYLGILFNYIVGPLVEYQTYTYICAVFPIVFTVIYSFMPESPYYLLMREKHNEAQSSLQWLRGSANVDTEFKSISESVEREMKNKGGWRDLIATKRDRKAFFIVQLVCLVKYLNGTSAVVSYATETFKRGSDVDANALTIALGVILLLSCFGSAFISDSVGRRPLLLFSIAGSTFFNIVIATYYFLAEKTSIDVTDYYWVMFIALGGFCISGNIGLGPLLQTMQAEYFPSNTRGIGGGITEMTASVAVFLNLKAYQMLTDYFGVYMNYVTFAFFGIVGYILLYLTCPETAGKSLGDIQKTSIKDGKKANADNVELH